MLLAIIWQEKARESDSVSPVIVSAKWDTIISVGALHIDFAATGTVDKDRVGWCWVGVRMRHGCHKPSLIHPDFHHSTARGRRYGWHREVVKPIHRAQELIQTRHIAAPLIRDDGGKFDSCAGTICLYTPMCYCEGYSVVIPCRIQIRVYDKKGAL